MTILEKLHAIEKAKTIYNIHYCNAGVGFVFYYPDKVPEPERVNVMTNRPIKWEEGLSVERYYPTFEEAVEAEYENLTSDNVEQKEVLK